MALICSQQYPEKLGKICAEIDVNHAKAVIDKTQFSMLIPEFENKLKELFCDKPDDVVLYGLEVIFEQMF